MINAECLDRLLKEGYRLYVSNIQGKGGGNGRKLRDLRNRTASGIAVCVATETNLHPGSEDTLKMDIFDTCEMVAYEGKKLGYGTAILTKGFSPENYKPLYKSDRNEILAIGLKIGPDLDMTIVGTYRSPNSNAEENADYFSELEKVLATRIEVKKDQLVILCGDINTSDVNKTPYKKLMSFVRRWTGHKIITRPTRGENQPDHAIGFYNPVKVSITGVVVPGVADHSAIVLDVASPDISKEKVKWKTREVVIDTDIDSIREYFSRDMKRANMTWEHWSELAWNQVQIDRFTEWLIKCIHDYRYWFTTKKKQRMPEGGDPLGKEERAVQYDLNRLISAVRLAEKEPNRPGLWDNVRKKQDVYSTTCREQCLALIERDMEAMQRNAKVDPRKFFKWTAKYMKFDGTPRGMTQDEIDKKLEAAELNYVEREPMISEKDLVKIVAENTIDWQLSPEFIASRIAKLKKVDSFFKEIADVIAQPLSVLLNAMTKYGIFPTPLKCPSLVLLPKRTIFFLDFWAKIVEDVINHNIIRCQEPDAEGQMAYQKGRSTEPSCSTETKKRF